jgi:hypothetical protein
MTLQSPTASRSIPDCSESEEGSVLVTCGKSTLSWGDEGKCCSDSQPRSPDIANAGAGICQTR